MTDIGFSRLVPRIELLFWPESWSLAALAGSWCCAPLPPLLKDRTPARSQPAPTAAPSPARRSLSNPFHRDSAAPRPPSWQLAAASRSPPPTSIHQRCGDPTPSRGREPKSADLRELRNRPGDQVSLVCRPRCCSASSSPPL